MRVIVERFKIMYQTNVIDDAKLVVAITKYKLTEDEIAYIKGVDVVD